MKGKYTAGGRRQGRRKLIAEGMGNRTVPTSPYLQPQRLGSAYCQQAWHRLLWS